LLDGSIPERVKVGDEIEITLNIANQGWASPFNRRPIYLVLRNVTNKDEVHVELKNLDSREWRGQTTTGIATKIKADVSAGSYDLYLYLPDAMLNRASCKEKNCDSADYAIRFANKDLWEMLDGKPTGLNSLKHRLIVE
jgi:hypothetical protein